MFSERLQHTRQAVDVPSHFAVSRAVRHLVDPLYLPNRPHAAPGARVLELIDMSGWQLQTRNVGELDITRVQASQEVVV